jgi:hypothetical protein
MTHFPDPLKFQEAYYKNGSMVVRMTERFRYISSQGKIIVPRNFYSDGASVPRMFWSFLSPFGSYFKAALIHDFLYSKDSEKYYPFDRKTSDLIFKEAMFNLGIGWAKRETIYRAVRLGGWASFRKKFSHD